MTDYDDETAHDALPDTLSLVLIFVSFAACCAVMDAWGWLKPRLERFLRSEWAVYAATVVLSIVGSAVHPGPLFGG